MINLLLIINSKVVVVVVVMFMYWVGLRGLEYGHALQCLANVFIPLSFHILLCCCLMLTALNYFFYISLHYIHHIDKAKT